MAADWYFKRPELARDYLREFERLGARALTMFAERGTGKTAFLQKDLGPLVTAHDRLPVYLDLWSVRTDPAIGIADQLKYVVQQLERKDPSKREVAAFNISVLGVGGGINTAHRAEPSEPANPLSRINFWNSRLAQLAGKKKVMLMLDEVQELANHADGANVASALRASFQSNEGKFEPIFTGSHRDRLLQMFKTSKAPLFNFGDNVDLPLLDQKFSAFVAARFHKESGIKLDVAQLDGAFEALGRKPGSLIEFTRGMIRSKNYDLVSALAKLISQERLEHERTMVIAKLQPLDQAVLYLAALDRPLFSKEALEYCAQQLGVDKVTPRAVQGSVARLRDEELIWQVERGVYRVSSSLLADQLREKSKPVTVARKNTHDGKRRD